MKGYEANGKTFKVHLDGYNLMPFLKGDVKESPRKEFLYWSDDGDLMAIRYIDWKPSFLEQYHRGPAIWEHDFTPLGMPNLYNLRSDPFERGPIQPIYRLDGPPYLSDRPCTGRRRAVAQPSRSSPPPEARELQPRRVDAEAVRGGERRHLRSDQF